MPRAPKAVVAVVRPERTGLVWKNYQVMFTFVTPIYGGFPASEDVLQAFIAKKMKDGAIRPIRVVRGDDGVAEVKEELTLDEKREQVIASALSSVPETKEEEVERRTLVFRRNMHGHLMVVAGSLRAHVKDCARVLSTMVMTRGDGEKSLNIRATNGLYVIEDQIVLKRDGHPMTAVDGTDQFFVHATNPRTGAPMSSIKQCERLDAGATLTFTLSVLSKDNGKPVVSEEELGMVLNYGAWHGYGQERSRGMGRYIWEVRECSGYAPSMGKFIKASVTTGVEVDAVAALVQ